MLCPICHGQGKEGNEKCKSCGGTGFKLDRDVSDEVVLPIPDKEDVKLAPDIAGWIHPDKEILDSFNDELDL